MNDLDEHDDDPEGVTLWSGRLRAWPAAPGPDGNEDDTVVTRRSEPGGGTASSRPAELDGTLPPEVDTSSSRAVPRDDPPLSPIAPADHRSSSAFDDVTAPSRSRTPQAGVGRSLPEDASAIPAAIGESAPASVVDTSTAPRTGIEPRLSASVADTEADSARRGARPPVPVSVPIPDGEPPTKREARSPVALQRESYAPRVDAPARVARVSTGGAGRSGYSPFVRSRRSPRRAHLVVLTAAVVVVLLLAVVGVAFLLG